MTARPLPAGCAGAGSICRITFCPVGAVAGGVASWAPGSLRAGGGTVWPSPACRHTEDRQPCVIGYMVDRKLFLQFCSSHAFPSLSTGQVLTFSQSDISSLTVNNKYSVFYPLCRNKSRQSASSRQSFHRSTPGSSSCHRCHFYMDSHSEPPAIIINNINLNNKPQKADYRWDEHTVKIGY